MAYRTKTYIAGDWDNDIDAINQLYTWKNSHYWSFDFLDAHEVTSARDYSLNCSIKRSLKERLDVSKNFVLIVGKHTNSIMSGSCRYCSHNDSYHIRCTRGYSLSSESFVEYECRQAVGSRMNILVLYNSTSVDKNLCPEVIRNYGRHIAMKYAVGGLRYWDYLKIKLALDNIDKRF